MKTLIIAEIGHNHNGDMTIAKQLINEAKTAGAGIAKFQLYDTDKLGIKEAYGQEVYDDLKTGELTRAQLTILKDHCDKVGIEFLCSVFDIERVGWTEEIGMKRYKIASRSIKDRLLIEQICRTGKDIIASLGMWEQLCPPIIETMGKVDFLYCIAKYPTLFEDIDMPIFNNFDYFGLEYSGFSDHTIGIDASLVAVSRGAQIIEKHFTIDRNMPGYDQEGSIEPAELKEMIKKIKIIEEILH